MTHLIDLPNIKIVLTTFIQLIISLRSFIFTNHDFSPYCTYFLLLFYLLVFKFFLYLPQPSGESATSSLGLHETVSFFCFFFYTNRTTMRDVCFPNHPLMIFAVFYLLVIRRCIIFITRLCYTIFLWLTPRIIIKDNIVFANK